MAAYKACLILLFPPHTVVCLYFKWKYLDCWTVGLTVGWWSSSLLSGDDDFMTSLDRVHTSVRSADESSGLVGRSDPDLRAYTGPIVDDKRLHWKDACNPPSLS